MLSLWSTHMSIYTAYAERIYTDTLSSTLRPPLNVNGHMELASLKGNYDRV